VRTFFFSGEARASEIVRCGFVTGVERQKEIPPSCVRDRSSARGITGASVGMTAILGAHDRIGWSGPRVKKRRQSRRTPENPLVHLDGGYA
jgi:hypothetical protein